MTGGRRKLAHWRRLVEKQAVAFLPYRATLDLAGWKAIDIFEH